MAPRGSVCSTQLGGTMPGISPSLPTVPGVHGNATLGLTRGRDGDYYRKLFFTCTASSGASAGSSTGGIFVQ